MDFAGSRITSTCGLHLIASVGEADGGMKTSIIHGTAWPTCMDAQRIRTGSLVPVLVPNVVAIFLGWGGSSSSRSSSKHGGDFLG